MAMWGTTALGAQPPDAVTSDGQQDTAMGLGALANLSAATSGDNTAAGAYALNSNISGNNNTAVGVYALNNSTVGSDNTAIGTAALLNLTSGEYVTAVGYDALYNSQSGLANIGLGPLAGQNIEKGSLNIDIGSWGSVDESNTIRIGLPQYHLHTFIAGIASTQLTGAQVVVTSNGQLGVLASSERYKTDIAVLGGATDKLVQLRPVSFHLKSEPNGAIQYGLIAEEVDKVYPELVIRDNDGRIQGVRYDELAPLLLVEVQKQARVTESQAARIEAQDQRAAAQDAEISELKAQLADIRAALALQPSKDELVAQR